MVQSEDIKLELVCADTKNPFQEHEKGGNHYAEVEPDAEYFISLGKTKVSKEDLYCRVFVDGKDLGYYIRHAAHLVTVEPGTYGVLYQKNGVSTRRALKFEKAMFSSNGGQSGSGLTMGQVKVEVYQAVLTGAMRPGGDHTSSFSTATIDNNQSAMAKKKGLRSGEGSTEETHAAYQGPDYTFGPHLYTVTLNYCAAVGLISVGVLDKPPLWDYHRMLNPAQAGGNTSAQTTEVHRTNDGKHDLLHLADNDDSDDENSDCNAAAKKVKRETK